MTRPPSWAAQVTLTLSTLGLAISSYLTWAHYQAGTTLSCPDTGVVNCLKVTTSTQSMIAGIVPVALAGTVYFALMTALCLPQAWTAASQVVQRLRLAGAVVGILTALYLVAVELLVIRAICLWCTAVHVLTFALFIAVLAAFLRVTGANERTQLGSRLPRQGWQRDLGHR